MQKADRSPVLRLDGLRRSFKQGEREIHVLRGASAALFGGEVTALVGPSGAGKSTLLHICGLLESPTEGRVVLNGRDCAELGDADRTQLRRNTIGFVYQFHQLLPEFSALENVVMPQLIAGRARAVADKRGRELLDMLGLKDRMDHRPAEMSGGEQQRTAIARGLANKPKLLLADEPTGNLDPRTSDHVFHALAQLIKASGLTVVLATHNMEIAARMDRRVTIRDGQIVELP